MKAFKICLFLFIIFSNNIVLAQSSNFYKCLDDIKKIKDIDEEKIEEGLKIIKIIRNVYNTLKSFLEKINNIIFTIIKTIFSIDDRDSKASIFIYREI